MFSKFFVVLCTIFTITIGYSADKLAVAEPVAKGGIKANEIEAIWGMLESGVGGGFDVISRSAVKTMMTEIGFTTSSNLVNLNSTQKARLGKIATVKYILVSTVSKFGTRINVNLLVLDASTGKLDPDKRASVTVKNFDELSDKLNDMLSQMGLGRKIIFSRRAALLYPIIKTGKYPQYLKDNFSAGLENILINGGVKLFHIKSVYKIMKDNKLGRLDEAAPAMYKKIGVLLRADILIQPTINRFSIIKKKVYVKASKRTVHSHVGNIAGSIRIISAKTGDVVANIPFRLKVNFDDVDEDDIDDWTSEDYGRYLIETILPVVGKKVVAKLK